MPAFNTQTLADTLFVKKRKHKWDVDDNISEDTFHSTRLSDTRCKK